MAYLSVKLIASAIVAFFCSMVVLFTSEGSDNPYLERFSILMLWVAGALVVVAVLYWIWF